MLHNAHPKRNIGSAKRGEPSEAKSGEPINVVHVSITLTPLLTTAVIFRCIGSYDHYRIRVLHLLMDEKKNGSRLRVVLTKEVQGGNVNTFTPQSD